MIKSLIYSSLSALAILSASAPLCADFSNNMASHEYMAQATPAAAPSKSSSDDNLKGKEAERRFLESPIGLQAEGTPTLIIQTIALASMAMMPFLLMLLTPFAKFVMVFSLLRNALGVQQVPPNQVINGIALILSIFVIFPVGLQMYKLAEPVIQHEAPPSMSDPKAAQFIVKVATIAKEPLRTFLINNSLPAHQKNFYRIAFRMLPEELKEYITVDHFIVLIPSYITSQVKNGFEIGVLIYLPFFVIDLVVSNILLAMGMMMLSPVTISMPLKIFMLVMLDGWTLLTQGLILSYR